MTSKGFNPGKDFEPMPFDERVCRRALEIKNCGLAWQPHIGCFVWDPDGFIKAPSPFPGRIYFILSLARFVKIFGTVENIAEKLVWLPTWHQAQHLCRLLGIADEAAGKIRQMDHVLSPVEGLLEIYGLIIKNLRPD